MIKLTKKEKLLFDLLLKCLKNKNLDLTLRVAGGWVRDKLLNKQSVDIDITLDKMMGRQFVEHLKDYLDQQHIENHKMGIIKKNPDQSKHLETATIEILDYEIDFVNLRGEEYTEDSRIPIQKIGTPNEDAFRRDFTINSLFYNINENKIEDFTQKGLEDLQNKILRTPLCPIKTFIDDPLRVLRGFRFAARYGFKLEQQAYDFIKESEQLKQHFSMKISKERIGKEFLYNFDIQKSKKPLDFLYYLHDTQLLFYVFENQDEKTILQIQKGYDQLDKFVHQNQDLQNLQYFVNNEKQYNKDEVLMIIYLSILTYEFFTINVAKQDFKYYYGYKFCRNQLKFSNKLSELCARIQFGLYSLIKIANNQKLEELALWQRQQKSLYKIIDEIYNKLYTKNPNKNFTKIFKENNLEEFYKIKPLLNGKEVIEIFKVKGKEVSKKIEEILKWQSKNPNKKKPDFLKTIKNQFLL